MFIKVVKGLVVIFVNVVKGLVVIQYNTIQYNKQFILRRLSDSIVT